MTNQDQPAVVLNDGRSMPQFGLGVFQTPPQWIKLKSQDDGSKDVYVNLANASSIWPHEKGSDIRFLAREDKVENGHILVKETPDEIFRRLREVPKSSAVLEARSATPKSAEGNNSLRATSREM